MSAFGLPPTTAINPPPYYNTAAAEKGGMKYVRFGKTGAVVSRISLGVMVYGSFETGSKKMFDWLLDEQQAMPLFKQALDAGITSFDTAESYSDGKSEIFLGGALKQLLPTSRFTREDLFIATKILPVRSFNPSYAGIQRGFSRKAIFAAVDGSLARLQLDYIDLYILQRYDPNTAPEETVQALKDLITAGKIRYAGLSSMFVWQLDKLQRAAEKVGLTFVSMQNCYNAIYREEEREMIPYCIEHEITITPWAPLASGILTRKPGDEQSAREKGDPIQKSRYYKTGDDEVVATVRQVAENRGVPPAQVALAWLLGKPGVSTPIIGATKPHHIADAVEALQLQLTEKEVQEIENEYRPHAISSHT